MNNTILIVDDMKINIDSLTSILRPNYSVMAAIGGQNAIRLLGRKKPDLVLLDVSMPDIDGFSVLQFMKEREDLMNIPVIFVTGEHSIAAEEKGLELGAVDYVKKPYNESVVRVKVRNQLELKNYRDNLESLVSARTIDLEKRTQQLAATHEAIIMGMSLMSESHDKVTGDHIERIKGFTKVLAEKMLEMYPDIITRDLANQIIPYSPLHDVGKVGIPDSILKKTGQLTPEEFTTMKNHTLEGVALLKKTEHFLVADEDNRQGLEVAIDIAECHHEKFNGKGYPHGLKGEAIPLPARIVSIADVYDALRSPRQYKRAFSYEETLNIILVGDGRTDPSHFDPKVLEVFKEVHGEFEKILEASRLNNPQHEE